MLALLTRHPASFRFQVEYAQEAVRKGGLAVGVRGSDIIVLGRVLLIDSSATDCKL